jgi:hypothetical protein
VEINFVDPFTRTGYRFRGRATVVARGETAFPELLQQLVRREGLADRARAVVVIEIDDARPLTSPAYDVGATEDELRAHYAKHFRALQPGGRFADEG